MNNSLLKILFGEEVTYHLLDDPGLVHYTEGLLQIFASKKEADAQFEDFKRQLSEQSSESGDFDNRITELESKDLDSRLTEVETQLEGLNDYDDLKRRVKALEDELEGCAELLQESV